jgi:hypothetical protein
MILSNQAFDELLPPYLHEIAKGRIRNALSQFTLEGDIDYSEFYNTSDHDFLMQADMLNSVKGVLWDEKSGEVESGYHPAMLISNSCDVTVDNTRLLNQKDALFAPIIPLNVYVDDCIKEGFTKEQINGFLNALRKQEYTNLFYLPPNPINQREYFVRLDRIYWLPISQFKNTMENLKDSKFLSLSHWAWYLFLVKLSLHTCRVPETIERPENIGK